ncbi:transposase [Halobiforma lacisalsi AJ5]|uniref:Transposase n=1 Tax=Natronobacterium lacisalsi AJ5 TaxID=358396 RepID=M0LDB5_NATLA|nr:hypothetical protein [Halobiforma lacisalsi]APW99010.1 transposase [Halobiforma lacisalsi AJ5]EMA30434.1 hypothetical protein C445_16529 [Halobiforma lacisalsi AJ5]
MTGVTVPAENRPSIGNYVIVAVAGIMLFTAFIMSIAGGARDPAVPFGGVLVVAVGTVAVLVFTIGWLVEEWIDATEVVDE